MARSVSSAKALVSLVADNVSVALNRRGYAAAAQGVAGMSRGGQSSRGEIERSAENSWVPDPITGYYKPANRPDEIDVAELREIFLKQKK